MKAAVSTGSYASQSNWLMPATHSPRYDLLGNVFACIIPMTVFIEVRLVGRLFLPEILLLCMLPTLLMVRGRLLFAPVPKKFILLGLAWLLAQIVTDVIRGTPYEDWSRGWSKITFLLLNVSAIYLYLNGKEDRFLMFAVGSALGQILAYFLNSSAYADTYPWKFGYGTAISLLAVLASQSGVLGRRKFLSVVIVISVGILNLYMDFRSLGLICLLVGGFLSVNEWKRFDHKKMKLGTVAILILLGGVAISGIKALYDYGTDQGWMGDESREKYEIQSEGDLGVLLGGRGEILSSVKAIMDSPIIGHGSWAKDLDYVEFLMYALGRRGYQIQGESESDLIPSHSYLFGAWVEAGILGAVFWFWVFMLAVRALIAIQGAKSALVLLIAFGAFNLLWDIPYSPFGGEARLYAAFYVSLMMFVVTLLGPSMAKRGLTG